MKAKFALLLMLWVVLPLRAAVSITNLAGCRDGEICFCRE